MASAKKVQPPLAAPAWRQRVHTRSDGHVAACPLTDTSLVCPSSVLPLSICFCKVVAHEAWARSCVIVPVCGSLPGVAMTPDFQAKKEPVCSVATAKAVSFHHWGGPADGHTEAGRVCLYTL